MFIVLIFVSLLVMSSLSISFQFFLSLFKKFLFFKALFSFYKIYTETVHETFWLGLLSELNPVIANQKYQETQRCTISLSQYSSSTLLELVQLILYSICQNVYVEESH